jgi:hypothetical protein
MPGTIDWREYHAKRKEEYRHLQAALDAVVEQIGAPRPEPSPAGQRGKGRPPYSPKAMVKVNVLRIYLRLSYRQMEAYLRGNPALVVRLDLPGVPGQDTIHRHAETLTEDYLHTLNDALVARLKKTSSTSASMPPASRSRGTRDVGALPNPISGKARSGSKPTS